MGHTDRELGCEGDSVREIESAREREDKRDGERERWREKEGEGVIRAR